MAKSALLFYAFVVAAMFLLRRMESPLRRQWPRLELRRNRPSPHCFNGTHRGMKLAIGAHGHSANFEVDFDFKATGCSKNFTSLHFHSGGCSLVSAVKGSLSERDAKWSKRRESPPLFNLVGKTDSRRRAFLQDAFSRGSRSDWGIAMTPQGRLIFGVGQREFSSGLGRPVRDVTFTTVERFDDERWHRVKLKRTVVYVDGILRKTTKLSTDPRSSKDDEHALVDASFGAKLGEFFVGCIANVKVASHVATFNGRLPIHLNRDAAESLVDREQFEVREYYEVVNVSSAIRQHRPGTLIVVVTDPRIRFTQHAVAPLLRQYGGLGKDAVFARKDDRTIRVDSGIVAIRCSPKVERLLQLGDDRKIDKVLAAQKKSTARTTDISWSLFPSEMSRRPPQSSDDETYLTV